MAIIGIDLGTTNSLVSVWQDDEVQLIPNSFGEYLTPSIVSFDEEGGCYVGKVAKERLVTAPEKTFKEFKRAMGTSKVYAVNAKKYTPEEMSSFVLRQLKDDAENYLGESVTEAVISVPAYFNDKQRAATRNAGLLAGLKVERLINEPSSAALAYRNGLEEAHQIFIVFDFGGGTLDVSLVDAFDNIIEIQAVSGDNTLGGKDFNEVIASDFCKKNDLHFSQLPLKTQAVILRECELIKIELTSANEVNRSIRIGDKEYEYNLSNQQLINISSDLFKRMTIPLQRVLNDSQMTPSNITKVLLVGGSSKMPVVRHYIASLFDKNVDESINPDEIVGRGTGVVAGIKERQETIKDTILSDICPFTLGIAIIGNKMSPIINKNEILPCSKFERYSTVRDFQSKISFEVYQGESVIASNNLLIDKFELEIEPKPMREAFVDVRFSYDINGLFDIDITSPFISNAIHKSIVNQNSGLDSEELERRRKALNEMKIHPRDVQENRYIIEAAQRLAEECNIEQKKAIDIALEKFEKVLYEQNPKIIRSAYVELSMKLSMIEKSMFHFTEFDTSFWNEDAEIPPESENDDFKND